MIANYHTHTFRCGHAEGTDREYVEAAIESGFRILGFADHTPFPIPGDGCGMQMESLPDYVESILALREEYKDQIEIYLGLEVENAPAQFSALLEVLKNYPMDYLILGQHAVFGIPDYKVAFRKTENVAAFEAYYEQCTEAMLSGVFSYWAHPDVIYFAGDDCLYEERMRQLCRLANVCSLPLEINLNGMFYKRNYPNPAFWKIAGEENCPVIIGYDAHKPQDFFTYRETLEIAMELIRKNHLQLLETIELKRPF